MINQSLSTKISVFSNLKFIIGVIAVIILFFAFISSALARGDSPPSEATMPQMTFTTAQDLSQGHEVVLSWDVKNVDKCTATSPQHPGWNEEVSNSGTRTFAEVTEVTVFSLSCESDEFNIQKYVTVSDKGETWYQDDGAGTVTEKETETAYSIPALEDGANLTFTVDEQDDKAILSWNATNANTTCTASNGTSRWDGDVGFAGHFTALHSEMEGSTTFTLNCKGDGFNVKKEVKVSALLGIENRPKLEFTATEVKDTETVIEWKATNANTCTASGGTASWDGELETEGEQTITDLKQSTTFSLTCEGDEFKVKKSLRLSSNGTLVEQDEGDGEVTEVDEERGEYLGYMDGRQFIVSKSTTRESALDNCKDNAEGNPTTRVHCTWEGELIYDSGENDTLSGKQEVFRVLNLLVEKLLQLLDLYQQLLGFGGSTDSSSGNSGSTAGSGSNSGSSSGSSGNSGSGSSSSGSSSSGSSGSGSSGGSNSNTASGDWWVPPTNATWQYDLGGSVDTNKNVDVSFIDLFYNDKSIIDALHANGQKVACYISVGSFEKGRPDAGDFPESILGNVYDGWPDERWLDIRQLDVLGPIMEARLDLAAEKGCDGIDPDNIHGYENNTGFPLTAADQIKFNTWLANEAHERGMGIGQKNDISQTSDLVGLYDWTLNEMCHQFNECDTLEPYTDAGKAVFVIEYNQSTGFCSSANSNGYMAMNNNGFLLGGEHEVCW